SVAVFLLLCVDFRSPRLAFLVLANLPLALVGGVGGGWVRGAGGSGWGAWRLPPPEGDDCRSGHWSDSSRCSESPPATASCSCRAIAIWNYRKAWPPVRSWSYREAWTGSPLS